MKYIDYQEAISKGADPQGLLNFIKQNPEIQLTNYKKEEPSPFEQKTNPYGSPDVVSPFNKPTEMTQQFNNYNPFMGYYGDTHKGEDFATAEGEQGKFPIGGQVTEKGYDPAYGYNIIVRGFNPEEYKQLSAEDFINPQSQPENDSVRLSHLQELPAQEPGEYVATGSGGLKFGSTGNATGPHVDVESFPSGAPEDFDKKRSFTSYYDILLKMIESQ